MSILDLPQREFLAMLPELAQQGVKTDDLLRQYRAANSPLAGVNQAAEAARSGITDEGRRGVAGGLLSKDVGTTGMDALRSVRVEPMAGLLGMLSGAGQAVDAPMAAAQGLIPQGDMAYEALGVAGTAMAGGGAAVAPRGALLAGVARSADSLTDGEAMARRILDMRAAGRARDVTDDMMAQADPQYMYNNTPLPMDAASRAARAGDGGELYHATDADISALRPSTEGKFGGGVYTSPEPDMAESYIRGETGQNTIPLRLRGESLQLGNEFTPEQSSRLRLPSNVKYEDDLWPSTITADQFYSDLDRRALAGGYSAREYGSPYAETVVADPRNIRSRFARFDPEFAHLSNLSAANASPTAGLLGVSAVQEDKKELPFMNFMRGLLQ